MTSQIVTMLQRLFFLCTKTIFRLYKWVKMLKIIGILENFSYFLPLKTKLFLYSLLILLIVERISPGEIKRKCEGAGPCVAVLKPQDGVGIVSADAEKYRIEILVFRSNNNPKIKLWRSKQRDQVWSLDISWFRLLESKVKIPLLECRNQLACTVSLLGDGGQSGELNDKLFSNRHFLVEVKFEGHPAASTAEIVIRKLVNRDPLLSRNPDKAFIYMDTVSGRQFKSKVINRPYVGGAQAIHHHDQTYRNMLRANHLGILPGSFAAKHQIHDPHHQEYLNVPLSHESGKMNLALEGEVDYDVLNPEDIVDLSLLAATYQTQDEILPKKKGLIGKLGKVGYTFLMVAIILISVGLLSFCRHKVIPRFRSSKRPIRFRKSRNGRRRFLQPRSGRRNHKCNSEASSCLYMLSSNSSDEEEVYSRRKTRSSRRLNGVIEKSKVLETRAKETFATKRTITKGHCKKLSSSMWTFFEPCLTAFKKCIRPGFLATKRCMRLCLKKMELCLDQIKGPCQPCLTIFKNCTAPFRFCWKKCCVEEYTEDEKVNVLKYNSDDELFGIPNKEVDAIPPNEIRHSSCDTFSSACEEEECTMTSSANMQNTEDNISTTSEDEYSDSSNKFKPNPSRVRIAVARQPSFTPKTDISGRFIVTNAKVSKERTFKTDNTYETISSLFERNRKYQKIKKKSGKRSNQSNVMTVEKRPSSEISTNFERSHAGCGDIGEGRRTRNQEKQRQHNFEKGDGPTPTLKRSQESLVLVKEGFEEENKHMASLFSKFEKLASSCTFVDETAGENHVKRTNSEIGKHLLNQKRQIYNISKISTTIKSPDSIRLISSRMKKEKLVDDPFKPQSENESDERIDL